MKRMPVIFIMILFCTSCYNRANEQRDATEIELSIINEDSMWFYTEMAKEYLLEHDGWLYAFPSEVLQRIYQMEYALRFSDYYVFLDALARDSVLLDSIFFCKDYLYEEVDKEYSLLYISQGADALIKKSCENDPVSGLRIKSSEKKKAPTIAHYLHKSGYVIIYEDLSGTVNVIKNKKKRKKRIWGYDREYLSTPAWQFSR